MYMQKQKQQEAPTATTDRVLRGICTQGTRALHGVARLNQDAAAAAEAEEAGSSQIPHINEKMQITKAAAVTDRCCRHCSHSSTAKRMMNSSPSSHDQRRQELSPRAQSRSIKLCTDHVFARRTSLLVATIHYDREGNGPSLDRTGVPPVYVCGWLALSRQCAKFRIPAIALCRKATPRCTESTVDARYPTAFNRAMMTC